MKNIITGSIVGFVLLTSGAFAAEPMLINAVPTLYSEISAETTLYSDVQIDAIEEGSVKDLIKKNELIIRNNNLESDFKYNNVNYYTSKMKAEDIIVPEEIMDKAKRIYLLVEEGQNRVFFAEDAMLKSSADIDEVKKEYNFRIVDFKQDQEEYIFNNEDLVKDFSDDEFKSVQITLIAEFSDTEKIPLSNTVYISMNDKKGVLNQLNNEENKDNSFFGYYNSNDLEIYLEKLSEKMTRPEYKTILQKAEKRIKSSTLKNEDNINKILKSIRVESDFKRYVDDYNVYSETKRLFSSLGNAIRNQLQNIRAFDAIDAIFK